MTNEEFDAALRQIEMIRPEFRLELMDGHFTVGGSKDGTRWLVNEIIDGWGLELRPSPRPCAHGGTSSGLLDCWGGSPAGRKCAVDWPVTSGPVVS